jgi:hypothetical protein
MLATAVDQLTELDDHAFTEHFRSLELAHRRLDAEMAAVIAEGERRCIAAVDDHHSMKGWLKANANWSNAHVARARKLAKTIATRPAVGDALHEGRIGSDQADELAKVAANRRVADQLGDSINILLTQAEQLSFEDARTCLRRWETLADLDGAHHDRALSHERRSATVAELDGSLYLRATGGTGEVAAEVEAIFNQALEREFRIDVAERTLLHGPDAPASFLPRTDAQRRFDAMVSIFRRSVEVPADSKAPTPVVNILVDQRTLEEALARHGIVPEPTDLADIDFSQRRCETTSGTAIVPDAVVRAALQGHVRRVVYNSAGVITDMGRKRRLFTGSARQAAMLMATCCDFPGCDVPGAHTQIDHLDEWDRDNGRTDLINAGLGCNGHNRAKHRQRYTAIRHRTGHVVYYRRDGTAMLAVGRRHPDDLPDPELPEPEEFDELGPAA